MLSGLLPLSKSEQLSETQFPQLCVIGMVGINYRQDAKYILSLMNLGTAYIKIDA